MKKLTIRAKITVWFILILILIVGLTYAVFFYVAQSVVRDEEQSDLTDVVDWDMDTVRWHETMDGFRQTEPGEFHVAYGGGYLIIGDDFVELLSGVGAGIFREDGSRLFGDDLIAAESRTIPFHDGRIRTVASGQDVFYVYDRKLQTDGLEGLWIRGSVDRAQQYNEYSRILEICLILLPLLILLAAAGAYVIARRSLRPLAEMAETARSISGGPDLQRRIGSSAEAGGDEVEQLARSFDEMMQRLEGSFAAEKQFTSDVSHELRTPMAVILAQCELALEPGTDLSPEEAREALDLIRRQGTRMNELISDMLTYTRIGRQHEKYPFGLVDLSALTREVCQDFSAEPNREAKNISLKTDIASGILMEGSEPLLRRLLSNLISNGIRYGRKGGYVEIKLGRRSPEKADGREAKALGAISSRTASGPVAQEDEICLTVSDNGIGIAPDDLPRIFDRFYQADPARSGEGIGLGLSMVREIASIHGGRVEVDSCLGKGSVFQVSFSQ